MSYADLINEENSSVNFLVKMSPRRLIDKSTFVAAITDVSTYFHYKTDFDYGYINNVYYGDLELTNANITRFDVNNITPYLGENEYFYDNKSKLLYINIGVDITDSDDAPNNLVVTYEIYFSRRAVAWHRSPLLQNTDQVYYEPLLTNDPNFSRNVSDVIYGVMPISSSTLEFSNINGYFNRHAYDSSFYKINFEMYRHLNDLDVNNFKLVFKGYIDSIELTDNSVRMNILDSTGILDNEFRNPALNYSRNFFPASAGVNDIPQFFSNESFIHPDFRGRPTNIIYGMLDDVILTGVDYVENPDPFSLSVDGNYYFTGEFQSLINDVSSSGSSYKTTINSISTSGGFTIARVNSTSGFNEKDSVLVTITETGPSVNGNYTIINDIFTVGASSYFVFNDTIPSGNYNSFVSGTVGRDYQFGYINFAKNGSIYRFSPKYFNIASSNPTNTSGFLLGPYRFVVMHQNEINDDFFAGDTENYVRGDDLIYGRLYGRQTSYAVSDWDSGVSGMVTLTLESTQFGSDSIRTGTMSNPIQIILDIMKNVLKIDESEINTASFWDALTETDGIDIGLLIPLNYLGDYPTVREVLESICATCLIKLYLNDDYQWTIKFFEPIASTTDDISDDKISKGSFKYDFDYGNILSDVIVQYRKRFYYEPGKNVASEGVYFYSRASNSLAENLHATKRQKTFDSCFIYEDDADNLARRLSYYFGDRIGKISLTGKKNLYGLDLCDNINIKRTKIPGFSYNPDELREREATIVGIDRSISDLKIELDDQKGIQDNASGW